MVDILAPGRQRQLLDTYIKAHPGGVTNPQINDFCQEAGITTMDPVEHIISRIAIGAISMIYPEGVSATLFRSSCFPLQPGERKGWLSRYDLD